MATDITAYIYIHILRQIYNGRYIMAIISWQIYYCRYIAADILQQIYYSRYITAYRLHTTKTTISQQMNSARSSRLLNLNPLVAMHRPKASSGLFYHVYFDNRAPFGRPQSRGRGLLIRRSGQAALYIYIYIYIYIWRFLVCYKQQPTAEQLQSKL